MGKVMSKITRPIKNFNIEARAHKVISQEKPIPAPKYKIDIEESERLIKENPGSMQQLLRKDSILDTHLKDIYIESYDPVINSKQNEPLPSRPLPLERTTIQQLEFGFHEPVDVPIGRCTLRQALKFLTSHQEDTTVWNSTKIALDYKIPEDTIKDILEYYRIYKVYIPEKGSKVVLAEPSIPKKQIENESMKKLIEEEQTKPK